MTLAERYQEAKNKERPLTPAVAFIKEVANVTRKSDIAVRRWISGEALPDALTQEVLARHFSCKPEDLFPKAQLKYSSQSKTVH